MRIVRWINGEGQRVAGRVGFGVLHRKVGVQAPQHRSHGGATERRVEAHDIEPIANFAHCMQGNARRLAEACSAGFVARDLHAGDAGIAPADDEPIGRRLAWRIAAQRRGRGAPPAAGEDA